MPIAILINFCTKLNEIAALFIIVVLGGNPAGRLDGTRDRA